ncbi:hypothetical protein NOVO_00190 [Rickettsiales bacterium Ac37b]|nr:hypothetical protein NOVO_00190 [Rickettsiales bacterium Ac37b]
MIEKYRNRIPNNNFKMISLKNVKDLPSIKNNLINNADKQGFLFLLNDNEYLSYDLMLNLKWFISENPKADLIKVPIRTYSMKNIDDKYQIILDPLGKEKYPNYQSKIINLENLEIKYSDKGMIGSSTIIEMPTNAHFDLITIKTGIF